MKKLTATLAIAALLVSLVPAAFAGAKEAEEPVRPAGERIFLEAKCNMCHTVVAAGIGEPRVTEEGEDVSLPPDLSVTGSSRVAEWLDLYLLKKEAIDGSKHKKKFKGSDEERSLLVKWLVSLKAPVADSTAAGTGPPGEVSNESSSVEVEGSAAAEPEADE
ncbi:MAG: cytochrome c [Candidatus Eisenbacteria bacterium]